MITSPCNVFDCNTCEHHSEARCPGCQDGNSYLEKRGLSVCGVYRCAGQHELPTCGDCRKSSCELGRGTDLVCPLRGKFENRRWWAGRLAKALGGRANGSEDADDSERISERTVNRMRWYLAALDTFVDQGISSVSSWQVAQRVGVKAPLIRKDLSRFGEFGTPSLGYDVKYLRRKILDILKLNETRHVLWVGAQKLREHLPALERICEHNCHLVAVLDPDPGEVGRKIGDVQVLHLSNLTQVLANLPIDLAVLALHGEDPQKVANALTRAGVMAILNMTPHLLAVSENVTVRNVDIGGELLALSYYCGKRSGEAGKQGSN